MTNIHGTVLASLVRGFGACVLVVIALACGACNTIQKDKASAFHDEHNGRDKPTWAIAIHGGAGTLDPSEDPALAEQYKISLGRALDAGTAILSAGGTSLDACIAAVRMLEDDELFNAGRGAALTREGKAELDAAIMDGSTLKAGAVSGVTTVKNPVGLARLVMEQTRFILLAGAGAERFADSMSVERVPNEYFITERRKKMLEELLQPSRPAVMNNWSVDERVAKHDTIRPEMRMGTVGCVAMDASGKLAAATSTGGLTGKLPGRVGDAPQIGAGTYANAMVAISCTGSGEQFIRHGVARGVASRMELTKESVAVASEHFIFRVLKPDDGGMIAIDANGRIATPFSTVGMYRGVADSKGLREVKIWK